MMLFGTSRGLEALEAEEYGYTLESGFRVLLMGSLEKNRGGIDGLRVQAGHLRYPEQPSPLPSKLESLGMCQTTMIWTLLSAAGVAGTEECPPVALSQSSGGLGVQRALCHYFTDEMLA